MIRMEDLKLVLTVKDRVKVRNSRTNAAQHERYLKHVFVMNAWCDFVLDDYDAFTPETWRAVVEQCEMFRAEAEAVWAADAERLAEVEDEILNEEPDAEPLDEEPEAVPV